MGTADKDYFLDENREVTTDEEKAAFVLIRKGQDIPKEMADKYGIGKEKTAEKGGKPASNKAKKPSADKASETEEKETE